MQMMRKCPKLQTIYIQIKIWNIVKSTSPMREPTKARRIEAKSPAKVPSTLTAPSVPLGTTLNVVTRYLYTRHRFK